MSKSPESKPKMEAAPSSPHKRYTDSAVREAYHILQDRLGDPKKATRLITKTCNVTSEELHRILADRAPAEGASPPPLQPQIKRVPMLSAPPPSALFALKEFALRDNGANATLWVAVDLEEVPALQAAEVLNAGSFQRLPEFDRQGPNQQAIFQYIASELKKNPSQLRCGAKNVLLPGAENQVGRVSTPGLQIDEVPFEPHLAPLRHALAQRFPKTEVRYLCLPPLEISKLLALPKAGLGTQIEPVPAERAADPLVTERLLRSRSRDMAFIAWVAKRWPQGGELDQVISEIEYADWLISLLAYTRYPGHTMDGKRMLVRLACLCAVRAQRWGPDSRARTVLAAAERWLEEPSEENRVLAGTTLEEAKATEATKEDRGENPTSYILKAVMECAMRAAKAASSIEPSIITGSAARSAAAAVMAATFAAHAQKVSSWLELVSTPVAPSETTEHHALCVAIRAITQKEQLAGGASPNP